MPQYFFHMQTDVRVTDGDGLHLDNDAAARREAIQTTAEMVRDCPEAFWGTRPWTVTVTDAAGLVLYEIAMGGTETRLADA